MNDIDKQINDFFFSTNGISAKEEYQAISSFVHHRILFIKLKNKLSKENKIVKICCKLTSDSVKIHKHKKLIQTVFDFYIGERDICDFLASEQGIVYQKVLEIAPDIEKDGDS